MASWGEVEAAAPEFGAAVRERIARRRHATLATLRADGSPRISGIETEFEDGEILLGMGRASRKARDLLRDPRMALHSGTEDPPATPPPGLVIDATVSGLAVEVRDPEWEEAVGQAHGTAVVRFRIDVREAMLIVIGDPADHLRIDVWREGRGLRRLRRA